MDVCTGINSFPEEFGSCLQNPCFPHHENGKRKISMQDLEGSESLSVENEGLTPDDLRFALSELHVEDYHETECFEDQKLRVLHLTRAPTFPCAGRVHTSLPGGEEAHSALSVSSQSRPELERCTSLPIMPRLVSAMKGGREREGAPPRRMQVKWAEDVYDPPATSMSHTLRNNGYSQQRNKSRKKDLHKNKHKKKKKPIREKQPLPDRAKVQDSGSDAAPSWQEAKCGSSVLAEQLEKLQFSVAEAT